jgi:hypothetical protein
LTLNLKPHGWWWSTAQRAAAWLPVGRTAADRFNMLVAIMGAVVVIRCWAACAGL